MMINQNTAETISILQQKCDQLYKNGKYSECIENMEELVSMKKYYYGEESSEFIKSSERFCEVLNLSAMIYLQYENFEIALEYLKKAEILCHNSMKFKATTYNNLACFYRRTGKLRTAHNYLQMALDIELKIGSMPSLADTHLNLCAVLSQLDKHSQALEHSLLSIVILQDEFLQVTLKQYREQNGLIKKQSDNQVSASQTSTCSHKIDNENNRQKISDDRLAVLAIAFHNLGVELEHLKRFDESMKIYNRALNFAQDNLGQNHSLVQNLTKVLQIAFSQLEGNKAAIKYQTNYTAKKPFREMVKERVLSTNIKHINDQNISNSISAQKNLPKLAKLEKLNTCVSSNYYKPENQEINKTQYFIGNTPSNGKLIKRTMSGHDSIQVENRSNTTIRKRQQNFLTGSSKQTPTSYKISPQRFDFSNGNGGNYLAQQQRNLSANNGNNQSNSLQRPSNINDSMQFNHSFTNKSSTPNNNTFINTSLNNNYSFDANQQNDIIYNSYNINKLKLSPNQIGLNVNPNQSINTLNSLNNQGSICTNSPQIQQNININSRNQEYHNQPTYPIDVYQAN